MNTHEELLKELFSTRKNDFRLLTKKEILFKERVRVDEEGLGNIFRIAENSNNPLEIHLTTKGNYRIYNKEGVLLKTVNLKYITIKDFIELLKRY